MCSVDELSDAAMQPDQSAVVRMTAATRSMCKLDVIHPRRLIDTWQLPTDHEQGGKQGDQSSSRELGKDPPSFGARKGYHARVEVDDLTERLEALAYYDTQKGDEDGRRRG
jgi:hypothetical protein